MKNHIVIGEKLPNNIKEVIRTLEKDDRDKVVKRFRSAGKASSNNSVILGYHKVQRHHINMIEAVLKAALPVAKQHIKNLSNTVWELESELISQEQAA